MKKLIDFDELFDRKLAEYMEAHAADHSEKEWEDLSRAFTENSAIPLSRASARRPRDIMRK